MELNQTDIAEFKSICVEELGIELSETEVLLDRARRDIEARLEKLERSKRKS